MTVCLCSAAKDGLALRIEIRRESSVGADDLADVVAVGVAPPPPPPPPAGEAGLEGPGPGVPLGCGVAVPEGVSAAAGLPVPFTRRFSAIISTSFCLNASRSSSALALSPLTPPVNVKRTLALERPVAFTPSSSNAICRATLAEPALDTERPDTDERGSAIAETDDAEDDDDGVHARFGWVRISVPGSF